MRAFFIFTLCICSAADAAETTTFTYDALGRLDLVSVSGGPATGVASDYTYDPAGNRTQTAVTGATAAADIPAAPEQSKTQLAQVKAKAAVGRETGRGK